MKATGDKLLPNEPRNKPKKIQSASSSNSRKKYHVNAYLNFDAHKLCKRLKTGDRIENQTN